MKKQFLNPTTFDNCLTTTHRYKTGYLHTDAYVFSVGETYNNKKQNLVGYDITFHCGTHECYPFESAYWARGGDREFRIKFDLAKQCGAMYYNDEAPHTPLKPIIFWINNNGVQCMGTYLFNENPIILEFNGTWITMFHNDEFNDKNILQYVEAFTDLSDDGMKASIQAARNSLTVITAQDTGEFNSIFYHNL